MARPGDQVVCHTKGSTLVSVYEDSWHDELIFDIAAVYEEGYLLYVPKNIFLNDCIEITKANYKKFNMDKRFIDSYVYYVTEHQILRIHSKIDGMRCAKCDEFIQMSQANRADGTLVCWRCENYPQYR